MIASWTRSFVRKAIHRFRADGIQGNARQHCQHGDVRRAETSRSSEMPSKASRFSYQSITLTLRSPGRDGRIRPGTRRHCQRLEWLECPSRGGPSTREPVRSGIDLPLILRQLMAVRSAAERTGRTASARFSPMGIAADVAHERGARSNLRCRVAAAAPARRAALLAVAQEAYVHGVSTRKWTPGRRRPVSTPPNSEVSRICGELDPIVAAFATPAQRSEHRYLWVDATYHKVRVDDRSSAKPPSSRPGSRSRASARCSAATLRRSARGHVLRCNLVARSANGAPRGRARQLIGGLVGMPRFELGTSCTPSRRATRLRYIPSGSQYSTVYRYGYFFDFTFDAVFFFGGGRRQRGAIPPDFRRRSIATPGSTAVPCEPAAAAHVRAVEQVFDHLRRAAGLALLFKTPPRA